MKTTKILKMVVLAIILLIITFLPSRVMAVSKINKVTGVKTKSQNTTSITIGWNKPSGSISGYEVYMGTSKSGKYKKVATIKKDTLTKYKEENLSAGQIKYFKIRAYKIIKGKKSYGSYSKVLLTTTTPKAPKISKITSENKKVVIKWNKVSGASGYEIYMATSKNGKYKKVTTIKKGSTTSYTKTGLTSGKTYYFKVRAYKTVKNKKVYGSYSDKKSIKVKSSNTGAITAKNVQSKIGTHLKWFSAAYLGTTYGWPNVYKFKDVTGKVKLPGVDNWEMVYEVVGAKSVTNMKKSLEKYVSKSKFSKFKYSFEGLKTYKGKLYMHRGGVGDGPYINIKKAKVLSSRNGISKVRLQEKNVFTDEVTENITLTIKYNKKTGKYLITDWTVKTMY